MRVLLAQRDSVLAHLVVSALERHSFLVEWTNDGSLAGKILSLEDFDAIILDIDLPGKDGHDLLFQIKASGSTAPVLMLTACASIAEKLRCFSEGADDFLSMPVNIAELEARLHAVVRRSQKRDCLAYRCGPLVFDTQAGAFRLADTPLSVSPREHALLLALIRRAQQTVPKKALFDRVFGQNDDANLEAIEVIVWRLRKRIAGASVRIVNVRGFGYRLEAVEESGSAS